MRWSPWVQDSPEKIIVYLNSREGTDWSRQQHWCINGYGPGSGYMIKIFKDEYRSIKAQAHMDFGQSEIRWHGLEHGQDRVMLQGSDTPPERI